MKKMESGYNYLVKITYLRIGLRNFWTGICGRISSTSRGLSGRYTCVNLGGGGGKIMGFTAKSSLGLFSWGILIVCFFTEVFSFVALDGSIFKTQRKIMRAKLRKREIPVANFSTILAKPSVG